MKGRHSRFLFVFLIGVILPGCGGGGGGSATSHTVTISWAANHESAVNRTGGGYRVDISGQSPIDVPYVAPGPLTPTSVTTTLITGTYTVSVVAYSALSASGAVTGGSTSAASAPIIVVVP